MPRITNLSRDVLTCFLYIYTRHHSSTRKDICNQNTAVHTNYKSIKFIQKPQVCRSVNVTYCHCAYKINTLNHGQRITRHLSHKAPYVTGWPYRGSNAGRGNETFTCPNRLPRFKDPRSFLLNLHRNSFPRIKRPWREVHHSPPYSAEAEWSYTSTPPYAFTVWTGTT